MDCGTSIVKYILFIFNTLVSVLGILAIVFGVIALNSISVLQVDDHVELPPQAAAPMALIAIGAIVLFISFLGCCGAIREDVCMTMCYAVFLLILLILQTIIIIFLWINKDEISTAMGGVIDDIWKLDEQKSGVFDAVQKTFHCCGSNGPQDYVLRAMAPTKTCCPNESCSLFPPNYYGGCKQEFVSFFSGSTDMAKHFGLGLIAVELIGFVFACCLANNVRNNKRRNHEY